MNGKVFDIRRFSTHDGDGIRTTVFMKGCPLHCIWCQNPEGIDIQMLPIHMQNTCIQCGRCVDISENNGAVIENGKVFINRNATDHWNKMIDECPSGAIRMDTNCFSVKALLKELEKDIVFYRHGGGVTFSGGEPLMQADFLAEIMKELHSEKIHIAIETSLSISNCELEKVLPYVDCIYADMKIFDEKKHRLCTGLSNRLIQQNICFLLKSSSKDNVIIRTPLIPEFTATEENLSSIAAYLSALYPSVKYELLNYNPLAEVKYHLVDRTYCFKNNPKLYTKSQMKKFGEIVTKNGIQNLIMEI